jgi:stage II sporulation protein AA (anti-sigma F factor antagonist)
MKKEMWLPVGTRPKTESSTSDILWLRQPAGFIIVQPVMNICETRLGEVVVLAISGKLDGISAPTLEAHATRLLSEGMKRIVFDCSGLEYVSSAGLRVFLATAKQLQTAGGRCGFAALSPATQEVFRLSCFLELLEIHNTVADACA